MSLKRRRESDYEEDKINTEALNRNEHQEHSEYHENNEHNEQDQQKALPNQLVNKIQPIIEFNTGSKSKSKHKGKEKINTTIICNLPPNCSDNPQSFDNYKSYELHYISNHTNNCSECKKNFPTSKLLDLHISENHNPFMKIQLEKGERVFGCFVENCDKFFRDHKKRRLHLIDKHDYPKDFIFSIVDRGISKNDTSLIKKNTRNYNVWKPA